MTHQQDERGDPLTRTHEPARKDYAARESRQGGLGRPVLKVLGISLALAFLVWGAVEIWGERVDPSSPVDSSQTSSTSNGTQTPSQDTIDNTAPDGGQTAPADRDPTPQSGTGGDSQRVTPDGNAN
jgi:cytoskeletal protein RodZ